jgi:hypothetical protein
MEKDETKFRLRGLERTFEVSYNSVIVWIKKATEFVLLSKTMILHMSPVQLRQS